MLRVKLKIRKPFIFINAAMSLDGKISTYERKQVRISNDLDMKRVDELRASSDAILVGMNTVVSDDPKLNVKSEILRKIRVERGMPENPIKITLGNVDRMKLNSDFLDYGNSKKIIFTTTNSSPEKIEKIREKATVYVMNERIDLLEMLRILHREGIRRIMVEGGGETNFEFLRENLVDEIYVAIAPVIFGGKTAPTLVDGIGFRHKNLINLEFLEMSMLDDVIVFRYKVKNVRGYI
ncbi:MAG: 2,5-diamino-6-(ribosylamino)-4(3H)-pyrimidinone 5'-phosphate reductase [Candidatus Altiarchaeales archaeon]|nr:MAG: 2,5-diamino-6-(ribosylamino)-4(3H)-pyrimidinone 5'-phosphate reductase [Candidatus Altiarchaeales archaeon]RLI95070.1 MAG: 2,5-diamino-6-(ribosylamino)-4(3H)-pyrimidinone 5'-phosphate reductase [Candidatus Altiarchaeales archaeon]